MIHPINHLPQTIPVGVQTESGVEVIGFDLKPWLDVFPDMIFTVWPTRPGETEAYPANDQMMVGTVLYWHPDGYDTEHYGTGRVEISGVGDNQRKASGFVDTAVRATSLGTTKEPGENVAPWYASILKAAEQVNVNLDAVKQTIPDVLLVKMGAKNVSSHTQAEVKEAYYAGRAVLMVDPGGRVYTMSGLDNGVPAFYNTSAVKALDGNRTPDAILIYSARLGANDKFTVGSPNYSRTPNPYKLTIKQGDTSTEYDGSSAVEIDIPDGVEDPGTAHQQLVSDADGKAAWKPLEFWREGKTVTILSPTALVGADDDGDGVNDMFGLPTPWAQDMVAGTEYDISYNGVAYKCAAYDYHAMEPNAPEGSMIMGNLAIAGDSLPSGNPDAPFVLLAAINAVGAEQGSYGMLIPGDGAASVTLGVTLGESTIKTIPEDLLPDDVRGICQVNVEVTANTSNTLDFGACDKTWAQIAAAYAAGKTLQIKLHQTQDGGEMVFNAGIECEIVSGGTLTGLTVKYAVNMYANNDDMRLMVAADDGSVRFVDPN